MRAAISEVLETMYFTDVVFQQKGLEEPFPGWETVIEVRSADESATVRLKVIFGETYARELTGNMLGLDPEGLQEEDVRDAMQELANMVAGSCVVLLGPEKWRLGLPRADRALVVPPVANSSVAMWASGTFAGWASCQRV